MFACVKGFNDASVEYCKDSNGWHDSWNTNDSLLNLLIFEMSNSSNVWRFECWNVWEPLTTNEHAYPYIHNLQLMPTNEHRWTPFTTIDNHWQSMQFNATSLTILETRWTSTNPFEPLREHIRHSMTYLHLSMFSFISEHTWIF